MGYAVAVSKESRRRAVAAHLSVALLGLGAPYALWIRRSDDAFEAHHGQLALVLTGLLALVEAVHLMLHFAVGGVRSWLVDLGSDLGEPVPGWTLELLEVAGTVNSTVIVVEVTAAVALAIRLSRRAWRGETPRWFFIPQRTPRPWDDE